MNGDFLTRLIARETGRAPIVAPALPAPFLPDAPEATRADDLSPTAAIAPLVPTERRSAPPVPDDAAVTAPPTAPVTRRTPSAVGNPLPVAPTATAIPAGAPVPVAPRQPTAAPPQPTMAPPPPTLAPPPPAVVAPAPEDADTARDATAPPLPAAGPSSHPTATPPAATAAGPPTLARQTPPAPDPSRRAPAHRPVRITIGRIEVRAPAAAAPSPGPVASPPPPARVPSGGAGDGRRVRPPSRSLDDYLRERRSRR